MREKEREVARPRRRRATRAATSTARPTLDNPTFSLSTPGAAPIGVPNFFIDKFRIPPFLLSIYQAAGIQYGIRWEVLAAINEIETDYGRNLNISSAGAVGWMQFMPATWKMYGVDANQDGKKDPFNPVDAIFAAARYLRAAGGEQDIRKAIFAYNHADWYVDSVLLRARVIGGLPSNLVGSLTGLTQGRFPVAAKATYADDLSERDIKTMKGKGNKAVVVESGAAAPRDQDLLQEGRARGRRQRRPRHRDRHEQAPRPLRQAPGRLRQHVHVRAPGQGLQALPGAEGEEGLQARDPAGAQAAREGRRRRPRPPRTRRPRPRARRRSDTVRKASPRRQEAGVARRRAHRRPARPPSSACSPTRAARTRPTPAAPSRSSSARAASTASRPSRATSRACTASTAPTCG